MKPIEYLHNYLPYDLKFKHEDFEGIYLMTLVSLEKEDAFIESLDDKIHYGCWANYKFTPTSKVYKPILRPLSDLTIDEAKLFNYPDEGHLERSILSGHVPYNVWSEFVENHFDVFGLIEKGLAIDINTL